VVWAADDLGAWLVAVLAETGKRKLATLVLGDEVERALGQAGTAAVQSMAGDLCPGDAVRATDVVRVISQVLASPVPISASRATVLETLQSGIAEQLAVLDDQEVTGTGQSSAEVLGIPVGELSQRLAARLVSEVMSRAARGGPLAPLAAQLNADMTRLQNQKTHEELRQLSVEVMEAMARASQPPASAMAPLALSQLPPSVKGFTGRDADLGVLAGLLDPEGPGGPVVVSAVAGLAGVGKTTLAIEAGHAAKARGWYRGGVLFLDLHGYDDRPVEPRQALDALLRALGVPAEHIPPDTDGRAGLYRSKLAQVSDPVLVIADNASSEAQVRPLLPGDRRHAVLVTSRHTLAGLGARLVDLTVLDDRDAVIMLDTALRTSRPEDDRITGDPQAAALLAAACGGLPLALQITAAILIADPTLTAASLADELSAESVRLDRLTYEGGAGRAASSVAAAFELSYRRLDEAHARLFRLLPLNPAPDVSTAAAAVLAGQSTGTTKVLLADLARAHLAEAAPSGPGRWRMHDLLRLYAQQLSQRSDGDSRRALDRLLVYYLSVADAADDHLRALPGTAVPATFGNREKALAWLDAEWRSLTAGVTMAAGLGLDHIAMRLSECLTVYLGDWRRRSDEHLAVTMAGRDAARRLGYRPGEGHTANNLGMALSEARRFEEAITAHQEAAAIFRETKDKHSEGLALNNLGLAFREARQFEDAVTACQASISIFRKIRNRHGEGMALQNLGTVFSDQGRTEEAITAIRKAADIFRDTGDLHSQGLAMNTLGVTLAKLERFREAETASRDAVTIFRDTGRRHSEGMALSNLGYALAEVGRAEEAITSHHDAIAIFRDTGDRHNEGQALDHLGIALRHAGRIHEAIPAHNDATEIFRETSDRHGEGIALSNLGLALTETEQFEEAITAYRHAAEIFRDTSDQHNEADTLSKLGVPLAQSRRWDQAATVNQAAAELFGETGHRHRQSGALSNLGIALAETGRMAEAITALTTATAIEHETGDLNSSGDVLNNLGVVLAQAERWEEATAAHYDAAAAFREAGDRNSAGGVLNNLGVLLARAERWEEAAAAYHDAAAAFREAGHAHNAGWTLSNLGFALAESGHSEEGIVALQNAAEIFRETQDRSSEGIVLSKLGHVFVQSGRPEEATVALQNAAEIFREIGDQQMLEEALRTLKKIPQRARFKHWWR
jgi:tetratricopeptide (TPR) repeat protein